MKQGGVVIGVMADSLLKAATSSKWRKGLMNGHAVLVSPFYPEAGFSANVPWLVINISTVWQTALW